MNYYYCFLLEVEVIIEVLIKYPVGPKGYRFLLQFYALLRLKYIVDYNQL